MMDEINPKDTGSTEVSTSSKTEASKPARKGRKAPVYSDYKEPTSLYRYLAPGGKIFPARVNKISHSEQQKITQAVKKARQLALLPIGNFHYDNAGRPNPITPKPLSIH